MRKVALFRAGFALALLSLTVNAMAQSATGQITGTVKDATGAVVPGATVTVTSELTGSKREVVTGKDGNYVIPLLPVSTYSVTASLQGFKTAKRTGVKLNVDQVSRVDLDLQTGELTEAVEVQAGALELDTETASVGQVISQKQITDLPLNGRNFISLLFLGAGAVEADGEQGSMRQGAGNAISIMGSRPTSNNFMIDGTSNVDTALGTPAAILSIDALEEFKEQTKNYSAEYGFSANQINLVSKSGTNQFHGTLFGFMRNDSLDAKNFFDPPDKAKPELSQKQFGGVLTGPIIKNKTFFLINYDGTRIDRGFSSYFRVPNPAELAGQFSTTIIDPTTGQPFPNNTIPSSRFSRLAQVAQDQGWFPAPNADSPLGNYSVVRTLPQTQNQFTVRIDQDLGRFGRAYARYTDTRYDNRQTTGNVLEISDQIFVQNAKNWQVSHTWPIHSNLVNSFRVGHVFADAPLKPIACPQAAIDQLANTGLFQNIPDDQRNCPNIGIQGLSGTGGPVNAYSASSQPMWDVSNTTTWIKGNHTLNIGANYRRWWLQRDLATDFTGNFAFGNGFTISGNPVADFLLGYYTGASTFQPAGFSLPGQVGNPREMNFMYIAPYVQDDWKVNQKLTLNLGLRYDYRNVPYETNDHMAWRNPDYAPGGLLVADQSLAAKGIVDGAYYQEAGRRSPDNPDKYKVFAPRIGFAYRPGSDEKTVIRGGWGRFYDSAEGREIDGAADVYPYVTRGSYPQTAAQTTPYQTTDQLFPSFSEQGLATPGANTFLAVSMSPEPRNPYVDQWSLGVQRQLNKNTVAELNYVGSKGNNLLARILVSQATAYTPDNPTVAGRKPYPNFNVYIDSVWDGTSKYNAINAKLEHHGRSLLATFAYTYSKSTDSKSAAAGIGSSNYNGWQGYQDNHNPGADYGRSDFDVDHRAVASFVWNLPFGKGERYASSASGLGNAIIGGWQVNGIYIWQHGFPITVTAADLGGANDTPFGSGGRANLVGDPNAGGGSIEKWFNTSAFSQPALGTFGDSERNMLRAPTINNLDFALFKNFNLPRGSRLQFRFESFNAFNHPNFTGVSTDIRNADFGRLTSARPGRINQLGLKLIW